MICRSLPVGRAGAVTSTSRSAVPVPGDHFLCTSPLAGIVPERPSSPFVGWMEGRREGPGGAKGFSDGSAEFGHRDRHGVVGRAEPRSELPELSCFESGWLTGWGGPRGQFRVGGTVRNAVRSRVSVQRVGDFLGGKRARGSCIARGTMQNARCPGMQGSHAGASYVGQSSVCIADGATT